MHLNMMLFDRQCSIAPAVALVVHVVFVLGISNSFYPYILDKILYVV